MHNRMGPGLDLLIPERYRIEDQTFLAPFWEGFDLPDIIENIAGFVPLGFLFYAWLSLRPSSGRADQSHDGSPTGPPPDAPVRHHGHYHQYLRDLGGSLGMSLCGWPRCSPGTSGLLKWKR